MAVFGFPMALTPCVELQVSSMAQGYHKYQHIWEVTLAAIMADEDSNEGSGPQGCGKYLYNDTHFSQKYIKFQTA